MDIQIPTFLILFPYLAFVAAGIYFTGLGILFGVDGLDDWKWRIALGVSILVIAIAVLVTGVLSGFLRIEIIP